LVPVLSQVRRDEDTVLRQSKGLHSLHKGADILLSVREARIQAINNNNDNNNNNKNNNKNIMKHKYRAQFSLLLASKTYNE
jgi:hypothetical protein